MYNLNKLQSILNFNGVNFNYGNNDYENYAVYKFKMRFLSYKIGQTERILENVTKNIRQTSSMPSTNKFKTSWEMKYFRN